MLGSGLDTFQASLHSVKHAVLGSRCRRGRIRGQRREQVGKRPEVTPVSCRVPARVSRGGGRFARHHNGPSSAAPAKHLFFTGATAFESYYDVLQHALDVKLPCD